MHTVARNHTRRIAAIKAAATRCKAYNLPTNFEGVTVPPDAAWAALEKYGNARLTANNADSWTVDVHSNLWYELATDAVVFTNLSNAGSYTVAWTAGDHNNRLSLGNPKRTTELWFGAYIDGEWMRSAVVDPTRYGLVTPPTTFDEFEQVARAYVTA